MERRLKDRIPPNVLASTRRLPRLVLAVSTTLVVAPEAWARIQDGKSSPAFVALQGPPANEFVKHYNRDELKAGAPANPVASLDQRVLDELTGLLNRMARGFSGKKQRTALERLSGKEPTASDVQINRSLMSDEPDTPDVDVNGVRSFMQASAQKIAAETARSRSEILSTIGGGIRSDLKLGSLFSSDQPAKGPSGSVRYGLLIKDIVPDPNAPAQAALSDPTGDLAMAGHAEVQWTIGPLEETPGRKVFSAHEHEHDGGMVLPSPNFKLSAQPENFQDLTQVSKDTSPVWKVELKQEQDLYLLTYRTQMNGEKVGAEHTFKIPVAGTVAVGRRFNDQWELIETTAYNILYDKRLPLISVHQMHIEERYTAELTKSYGQGSVGLEARGKAEGIVEKERDRPEAYSLTFGLDF